MATALIPIIPSAIGDSTIPTVDARNLHAFLQVKARFNDWIQRRIETYGFLQDIDYTVLTSEYGPITTYEYHLSLDMAKQLSMVERTAKGKEARLYFLECERIAIQKPRHKALSANEMFLLQAQVNVEFEQKLLAQGAEIAALKSTVAAMHERQQPAGKLRIEDWLKRYGKPRPPKPVLTHLRSLCRDREDPEYFRPDWADHPLPYYSPETIAAAYEQGTRQLSFLPREVSESYAKRGRKL